MLVDRTFGADSKLCRVREAPEGQYDWGLLLGMLEHVENDTALLCEQPSRLPIQGRVLVSARTLASSGARLWYAAFGPGCWVW